MVAKPVATERITSVGRPMSHLAAQRACSASRPLKGGRGAPAFTPTQTP